MGYPVPCRSRDVNAVLAQNYFRRPSVRSESPARRFGRLPQQSHVQGVREQEAEGDVTEGQPIPVLELELRPGEAAAVDGGAVRRFQVRDRAPPQGPVPLE